MNRVLCQEGCCREQEVCWPGDFEAHSEGPTLKLIGWRTMEKGPFPLWASFLGYKMKVVIPALECECEGGLCGPGGHRGWESILPALGQGEAEGGLR